MSLGAITGQYDRLRPPPPPEALEWLLPARRDVVVDLGAGTGLLARALAAVAGHVIGVEPDDRMRAVLTARSPGVQVLAGRGEAIPLSDDSADAVLVSSAWHWMDPDAAASETVTWQRRKLPDALHRNDSLSCRVAMHSIKSRRLRFVSHVR